ncbi:serine/threonine protein kinase [bacterium]|nr:serine/threonine protein kinase [bacterium]
MRPVCLPEKYEIIGTLGEGGMGTVYHARDRILDRQVALKVLSDKVADDPQFVQRFTTEARAAASLNHPHIVQIYEFGQTGGGHFLAMELVDGPSLKAELKRRGRFTEAQTIALARQACAALAVAHAANVVHRDIKPDNIMFTRDGRLKLVDLGLAKRLSDDSGHTMTGQSMGTPHFISPEQILGQGEVDARADIYSLGATLYYLATGAVPFEGSSGPHIMSRHLNDPLPDPRLKAPDLGAGFCRVLGRMMAKSTLDRYQTVADVDADLLRLQRGADLGPVGPVASAVEETIFISSPDLASDHDTGIGAPPLPSWDQDELRRMADALARHVGPVAPALVKQACRTASTRAELVDRLADQIPAAAGRDTFRAKCERLAAGGETTLLPTGLDLTQPLPAADPDTGADPGATVAMPTTEITAAGRLDAAVPPVFRLDAATEARVVAALAAHVGPVAKVLVKRELKQARDLGDLATRLGSNVDDAGAQAAFTSLVRGLG